MSGRDKKTDNFSKCTLFVKGIPPSCTNEQLSETFSQAGPVKDCFIVNYKSSEGSKSSEKPRIGYVTYTSTDDVKSALKQAFSIDSKKLAVSIALKKRKKKKEKNLQGDTFEIVKADGKVAEGVANSDECPPEKMARKEKQDIDKKFSVLLGGLPFLYKKEHVLNLWKKNGLKIPFEVDIPYQKDPAAPQNIDSEIQESKTVQSAKISVVSKQAALKACNKLSGMVVGKNDNFMLKATLIAPGDDLKSARKSRLIVRNLSFKCSDNELRKAFDPYGTITEVKIPTRPNGLKLGFAFVQFSHVFEAARAIKAMNLQPIKDRKVAVDWSLPKEKYKELNTKMDEGDQNIENEEDASKNEEPEEEQTDDQEGNEKESASLDASDEDSLPDESGNDDVENLEQSDEEYSSENEEEEEEDSDAEVEEDGKNKYDEDLQKVKKKAIHNKNTSYDVHEGKTVFVMNLSFDTKEEKLTEVLAEYGKLNYTKIVLNHETGMSKGCGFAQFATAEDAQNCIDSIGRETSGLFLDGRQISAVAALTRGDTDQMRKEGKKKIEKEDKRNLYLAREGLIRAGTQAAEGLSQIELKKRERMENTKRAKLKNPSVFVSKTRLCVHNLPKSMEGPKLKEIILKLFPNKKAIRISECRIMRDRHNLNEKGIGRSLGYAFVTFSDHQNALTTLRSLNNNPDVFGPLKRPIVEFVLENKRALETKQQRQVKYQAKMKLKEKIRNVDGQTEWKKEDNAYDKAKKPFQNRKREGTGDDSLVKNQNRRGFDNSVPKSFVADRKSFQGASGTTLMGKKLPMPVHAGAKIRQKNKSKVMEQLRRSKKLNTKAGQQKLIQEFSQKKEKEFIGTRGKVESQRDSKMGTTTGSVNKDGGGRRKRKGDEDSEFNALVNKYTKKIMDNIPKPVKSGVKWYE